MIKTAHEWKRIIDLDATEKKLQSKELRSLTEVWNDQRKEIENSKAWPEFKERLVREWSVETGLIERVYTLDRGVTELLIEQGIRAALIPHETSVKVSPEHAAAMIQDHENAIKGLFDFVGGQRKLSTSYVNQLHAELMHHQNTVTGVDQFGTYVETPILKGEYKKSPNNPTRADGEGVHEYCPPEHVASEMDNLIEMHSRHDEVLPEVSAAWLHHRFAQIHPFQDGNGRVARCLATLVFLRAGLFPLIVRDVNGERGKYLDALERADDGNLKSLVDFFVACQTRAIAKAIGISEPIQPEGARAEAIIQAADTKIRARRQQQQKEWEVAKQTAAKLLEVARTQMDAIKQLLDQSEAASGAHIDMYPQDGEDRSYYFHGQIIECAKNLGYFASPSIHHQWLRLKIYSVGGGQTEMLFSFHGIGHEYRGMLACSVSIFNRERTDSDKSSQVSPATLLSNGIFQINYHEDEQSAEKRFNPWFKSALERGLAIWQQSI